MTLISTEVRRCQELLERLSLDSTVFGAAVCGALSGCLERLKVVRPLLFRDPLAVQASGISDKLCNVLSVDESAEVVDVKKTLEPAAIDEIAGRLQQGVYDCVVAVGGGATIDAAKLVSLAASNACCIVDLLDGTPKPNRYPIIAAPTTAGSGSEATHFAVLYVGQEKHSVADPSLRPRLAVVDPALSATAPERVAVAAGLDVLCQSIESLWAQQAGERSSACASEALRLVVPNLKPATIDGDPPAQTGLAMASHLAGHAIDRSFTTICHALSYYLTSHFGIPHGVAAAATLPAAVLFNHGSAPGADRWFRELGSVFNCDDVQGIASGLVQLIRSVGAAASITELDLPGEYDVAEHAASINIERLKNNPRESSLEDVRRILRTEFDTEGIGRNFA